MTFIANVATILTLALTLPSHVDISTKFVSQIFNSYNHNRLIPDNSKSNKFSFPLLAHRYCHYFQIIRDCMTTCT